MKIDYYKVQAELCRRSFHHFVSFFWDTIIAEPLIDNWHINYICGELQEIGMRVAQRLPKEYDWYIFNIPPGSSKSTIISEMYPLWCWTIDPTQRFICGSANSTIAEDIADKCYKIFYSEKFMHTFPELHNKGTKGGKTHFQNGLKGERYTTSTGSMIQGVHAHQKIVDDPMSTDTAYSAVERDKSNRWLSETLSSRNVSPDITTSILVMQRLHEMDSTGYLLSKNLKVRHICLPAEISEDIRPSVLKNNYVDGLLDPIRRSRQRLQTDREEYGVYGYAGQIMQRPAPIEGGILKRNWFEIVDEYINPETAINFQLDTAYTDKQSNDPTGVIAYYVKNNSVYLTNAESHFLAFPDLQRWLPSFVQNNGYKPRKSIVRIEPKASGKSIVQVLQKETDLNITESENPEKDKVVRTNSISVKIETGRVKLHRGAWNEEFIKQVTTFPTSLHDEYIDCLCEIVRVELLTDKINYKQISDALSYI